MILLLLLILVCFFVYEYYFPPIPRPKGVYPYALLLGCPTHADGSLCTSAKKRCQRAIQAYQDHQFETLVITGGAVKNQYTESIAMKNYILAQCSMPIICETRSKNTWENMVYSKEIIQNQPVLIITSGTHARRACAIAKQHFHQYSAVWYPEHRPKHIFREMVSRLLYIKIELQKRLP